MHSVKLYIMEEQEIFREAYKAFFPSEPAIELIGIAEYRVGQPLANEFPSPPDVTLMGTKMLEPAVIDDLEQIRSNFPHLSIVLLSAFYDLKGIKRLREFVRKSPKGYAYLLKHSIDRISQLTQVINSVAEGRVILDPLVMEGLMDSGDRTATFLKELTPKELEVLNWMAKGFRNATIAEVLCVDPKTIEHHINSIYSKFGPMTESSRHPRVNAVTLYLKATGVLPTDEFPEG